MPETKSNKRKVVCPECDQADVEIIRDAEGDDAGICPNCGLDVGRVMTRNRYEKALAKLRREEDEEAKKVSKKKSSGFWS